MAQGIRRLLTLYRNNQVHTHELTVADAFKSKNTFDFTELNLDLTTHGPDYMVDHLKFSLLAKVVEASTDVHLSVCLVLTFLRQLFY